MGYLFISQLMNSVKRTKQFSFNVIKRANQHFKNKMNSINTTNIILNFEKKSDSIKIFFLNIKKKIIQWFIIIRESHRYQFAKLLLLYCNVVCGSVCTTRNYNCYYQICYFQMLHLTPKFVKLKKEILAYKQLFVCLLYYTRFFQIIISTQIVILRNSDIQL